MWTVASTNAAPLVIAAVTGLAIAWWRSRGPVAPGRDADRAD